MSDGSVTVHRPELCRELLGWGQEEAEISKHGQPPSPSREGLSSPVRTPSRAHMARIEEWLNQKARRAVVALPDDPQLTEMKELCQQILDREKLFFSELDSFLSSQEAEDRCKREMLYRKWSERVFQPIHEKLGSKVNSQAPASLHNRRQAFDNYLTYQNGKAVFLDTTSGEEYNPLQETHRAKVATGHLDDPLLSQGADHASEQLVITSCEQGVPPHCAPPPSPLGRENTDPVLWLAMQLVHIDSDARKRSRQRMKGAIRNQEKGEESNGELQLPHKTKITYSRAPLQLHWGESAPDSARS